MEKIFKKKKGITLIALVITIIVLLILAGISISMLTGDNSILQKATEAKINTEEKSKEEQIKLEVMGSYGTNGTIDVATLKTNLEKIGATVTGNSLPLTVTLGGQEFTIDTNGNVEKSVVYPIVSNTLKAGDFVEYNNKPYIVLYDMDSEYNWVEIVSVNPLESVTLGKDDSTTGAQGTLGSYYRARWSYNNAIETLNNIAQKYLISDIGNRARCIGSNPSSILNQGTINSEGVRNTDNNYVTDYEQLQLINCSSFDDENYEYYWMASRKVDIPSENCGYGLVRTNKSGIVNLSSSSFNTVGVLLTTNSRNIDSIVDSYEREEFIERYLRFNSCTSGFRPVIQLISTTKVVSGDGTSGSPYKLQK